MAQPGSDYDEIMNVLLQCELKLRMLHEQGRLALDGLREFVELSTKVRAEIDRRHLPDRRSRPRHSADRRTPATVPQPESVGAAEDTRQEDDVIVGARARRRTS
jgi:hypothetical protein